MSALEEQVMSLSKLQKISLMEAIWADLTRDEQAMDVPDWHSQALEATEQRLARGESFFEDWTDVKRRLRDQ
jgi:hypothetical protein